jgi:Magnesium chelatase, subunit ChlI
MIGARASLLSRLKTSAVEPLAKCAAQAAQWPVQAPPGDEHYDGPTFPPRFDKSPVWFVAERGWSVVSVARASGRVAFPATFTLIPAMNPCSCV